jgi:hypothetical protein
MSKVAIIGNASGTGVFTVASPNSNVDRVLTLPDESGTVDTLQRSGNVIQVVNFQTGALATGTGRIPWDDSIPQSSEGDQYMSQEFTPTASGNILLISVVVMYSNSASNDMSSALFIDSGADAIASMGNYAFASTAPYFMNYTHKFTSTSTALLTFKVRIGGNAAGTTTFNGANGNRRGGGVVASSITITEYTA